MSLSSILSSIFFYRLFQDVDCLFHHSVSNLHIILQSSLNIFVAHDGLQYGRVHTSFGLSCCKSVPEVIETAFNGCRYQFNFFQMISSASFPYFRAAENPSEGLDEGDHAWHFVICGKKPATMPDDIDLLVQHATQAFKQWEFTTRCSRFQCRYSVSCHSSSDVDFSIVHI